MAYSHLMAGKPESAQLRLEVPYHDMIVERARHELLHVGIEGDGCDGIFVASERTLQRGILRLKYNNIWSATLIIGTSSTLIDSNATEVSTVCWS
jgi:hypothetical protein